MSQGDLPHLGVGWQGILMPLAYTTLPSPSKETTLAPVQTSNGLYCFNKITTSTTFSSLSEALSFQEMERLLSAPCPTMAHWPPQGRGPFCPPTLAALWVSLVH